MTYAEKVQLEKRIIDLAGVDLESVSQKLQTNEKDFTLRKLELENQINLLIIRDLIKPLVGRKIKFIEKKDSSSPFMVHYVIIEAYDYNRIYFKEHIIVDVHYLNRITDIHNEIAHNRGKSAMDIKDFYELNEDDPVVVFNTDLDYNDELTIVTQDFLKNENSLLCFWS